MHVHPPAMLHRKIRQLYQHVIGTGVLAGLLLEMGMFHLLKSSQMNLKLFQFPPFAPQDSITILNLLQHPVMLLNPFIYVINGPEIHVGASAPASFFLWVPPR